MTTYEQAVVLSVGTVQANQTLGQNSSIEVKKSGLIFSSNPSLHSWESIGKQILSVVESSTWWIADWLVFGEDTFQDRYLEAIKRTNLNYQTLRNYVWVARRIELSRRQDSLSFGHHAEVAALDPPEQDYWLRKAEEHRWSRNRLRAEVRSSLRERQATGTAGTADATAAAEQSPEAIQLRLTSEQMALFKAAADVHNLPLHEWIVKVLDVVARSADALEDGG